MEQLKQTSDHSLDDQVRLTKLLMLVGQPPWDPPSLEQLAKEARGYGKRRADRQGSRDNLIYRAGYGMDAVGALKVEPDVLAGVFSSIALLGEVVEIAAAPEADSCFFSSLASILAANPELEGWARQVGRCLCWDRLKALRIKETESFKASATYADPKARWRNHSPTAGQRYLIGEICRLLGLELPQVNRGEACDFIDHYEGNPRYWRRPSVVDRPRIVR